MAYRIHKTNRLLARAIAIFGAALILVSQLIGVAHFHESAVSHNGVAAAQISTDAGLCPICQLALHSPGSMAQATTVARGPGYRRDDISRRAEPFRVAGFLGRARARSSYNALSPLFDRFDSSRARDRFARRHPRIVGAGGNLN